MWTIYQLRVEGEAQPFYVGCTVRDESRRLVEHRSRSITGGNNPEKEAVISAAREQGLAVIEEVLETAADPDAAFAAEKHWIAHYGRRVHGGILTNATDGGRGVSGAILTEEARQKMSDAKKGNKINEGRKRPDMVQRFSKSVTAFDTNGAVVETYASARIAGEELNIHFGTISDCVKGRIKCARSRDGIVYQFRLGVQSEAIQPVTYKGRK